MPRDARQLRTRAALHRAILEELALTPFAEITVRQLARRAGIGYATFFRHYPGKEALLEAAAAHEIRRLVEMTRPSHDGEQIRASCMICCRTIEQDWALWKALLTGSAQATVRQELLRISLSFAATQPRSWPPQEVATAVVVGAVIEILSWWLGQEQPEPAEKVARLIYDLAIAASVPGR